MSKRMNRPGKGAKSRDMFAYARALGWSEVSTIGKHHKYAKNGVQATIPYHTAQPISAGVYSSLIKLLESV